jgi:hypothetical protein
MLGVRGGAAGEHGVEAVGVDAGGDRHGQALEPHGDGGALRFASPAVAERAHPAQERQRQRTEQERDPDVEALRERDALHASHLGGARLLGRSHDGRMLKHRSPRFLEESCPDITARARRRVTARACPAFRVKYPGLRSP